MTQIVVLENQITTLQLPTSDAGTTIARNSGTATSAAGANADQKVLTAVASGPECTQFKLTSAIGGVSYETLIELFTIQAVPTPPHPGKNPFDVEDP